MTVGNAEARNHALDALRAGALLLGVFGHAMISFFPDPQWVADDSQSSPTLLVAFFTQHIFRMSLFFAIAGFFAQLLLEKRGVRGFIANRFKRIALVFVVFWPLLLACLVLVALWAAGYAGTGPFAGNGPLAVQAGAGAAAPSAGPRIAAALWRNLPLGHTWFLYLLVWLYAGALALVALARLLDGKGRVAAAVDATVRALGATHLLPLLLAVPLALVFFLHQHWTAIGGIRTPDFGLVPNPSAIVGFGTAFAFGWFLRRQPSLLDRWQRWWPLYAVAAVALSVYCSSLMGEVSRNPAALPRGSLGVELAVAMAYPVAIWAWCFALFGAATRFLSGESKVIRYLSDASYWIYLAHLPLVVALQVLVSPWPLAWQVKYPLILVIALPILVGSYQLLVRNTWLGGWLNGRRSAGRARVPSGEPGVA